MIKEKRGGGKLWSKVPMGDLASGGPVQGFSLVSKGGLWSVLINTLGLLLLWKVE